MLSNMSLINTEKDNLLRDPFSKALIVNDDKAKKEWMKKKQKEQQIQNSIDNISEDIENLKQCAAEINTLRNEISEIKQLILSLNNNKVE